MKQQIIIRGQVILSQRQYKDVFNNGESMKKRKIVMFLCTEPQTGGGHQYALRIAECLVKNVDGNYEIVAMCCNRFWRKWCKENEVRCIENKLPNLTIKEQKINYLFPFLSKIYNMHMTPMGQLIKREKIDILLSTEQGVFVPNYDVKIIEPVHDLMHRYEAIFPEVREDYERREVVLKGLARYGAGILVDSRLGKKQFEESYMKSRKTKVIKLPFIVPDHVQEAKEEQIDVPAKFVFYPAQFWKHKNHINLVKAVEILRKRIEDVHLVLVGSEKNSCKDIKKYISNHELEEYITILGFVSNENITYLYRHAVGMIMPSYFGPTNIPPLEAMALGCPLAVSNKYAMPEQVGNAGLLFNPDLPEEIADCIEKLWKDEELREKLKRLGHKRINRWTKKDFEKKLIYIVKNI